jgi:hypothetical protein
MISSPLHSVAFHSISTQLSPYPFPSLPFLDLRSPTLNSLPFTPKRNIQLYILHPDRPLHEFVIAHSACIRPSLGQKLQHRRQEPCDPVRLLHAEMILFLEDVRQRPMSEPMDISELAFAVEDFLRPFAGEAERFGEWAEQFDDLRDVVVVFAVLSAGLGIEEVVTRDEFKDLDTSETG